MKIIVPLPSLIVLIGPSASGKSTFASKFFKSSEVISSDYCRELICDDSSEQSVTPHAFEVLNLIASKRLELGRLTVIDATNVKKGSRKSLIYLAKSYHLPTVAILFNLPIDECRERNEQRTERQVGQYVIKQQINQLKDTIKGLRREGFDSIYLLESSIEIEQTKIIRKPLPCNLKDEHGPFDIIGDIHGCFQELETLLIKLGYNIQKEKDRYLVNHPENRKVIFVGDLVDRGPGIVEVLKIVIDMVKSKHAFCVPGNHDDKLLRKLMGRNVQIKHGLESTLDQLENESDEFKHEVKLFLDSLPSHYVFDDGRLVVAHAGLLEEYIGRQSKKVRDFALYGEVTNETDENGIPIRGEWFLKYNGKAKIVYGHTPQKEVLITNNTINIDTGCVFGGKLTAYRYPEEEFIEVDALKTYYEPSRPFLNK